MDIIEGLEALIKLYLELHLTPLFIRSGNKTLSMRVEMNHGMKLRLKDYTLQVMVQESQGV